MLNLEANDTNVELGNPIMEKIQRPIKSRDLGLGFGSFGLTLVKVDQSQLSVINAIFCKFPCHEQCMMDCNNVIDHLNGIKHFE